MEEIWKETKFKNLFVSNKGKVKRILEKNKTNKPDEYNKAISLRKGYQFIQIIYNGKHINLTVHRLIAIAFIPNPNNYPYINHINSIRHDNRIENLEWCTSRMNTIHAVSVGKIKPFVKRFGENNPNSKLTFSDVRKIKALYRGGRTNTQIAKLFPVSRSVISAINTGKIWKSVEV